MADLRKESPGETLGRNPHAGRLSAVSLLSSWGGGGQWTKAPGQVSLGRSTEL